MLTYTITPSNPKAHIFHVELTIPQPDDTGQVVRLPAWVPGSYMIRDFAKHIVTITAESDVGLPLKLEKLDKQTWRCEPSNGSVCISYDVYAYDLSVRGAHLDTTHGYFNGTSVFLVVNGQEEKPCKVIINRPEGIICDDWRVATTLHRAGSCEMSFGQYQADNYKELIDHPVEMGRFTHAVFNVKDTQHEVAITGKHKCDLVRLSRDLTRICEAQADMFEGLPEMDRYLFMVTAVGDGYGGLEHKQSTSLICKRSDLPQFGLENVTSSYRQFLGLCSHEYFHLWNVKRIIPKSFQDSDLSSEAYSRLLWAFEGITSYYDDLMLIRSGVIKPEDYLELLAQLITRVQRTPGRLKQSVSDSSFDAWTKFYKQDENAPNAIVSYYAKGALIALALDLTIRLETEGQKSLDYVMRRLWHDYGAKDIGLNEGDFEEITHRETGLNLSSFFDDAVRGTKDLPLSKLLETLGIGMQLRAAKGVDDKGGVRKKEENNKKNKPDLGMQHSADGKEIKLTVILDDGAAQQAGLSAGDVLVAIDGIRVTSSNINQLLEYMPIGESVPVYAFRRDELMLFNVVAQTAPDDTCDLWFIEDVSEKIIKRRKSWLNLQ